MRPTFLGGVHCVLLSGEDGTQPREKQMKVRKMESNAEPARYVKHFNGSISRGTCQGGIFHMLQYIGRHYFLAAA